MDIYISAQTNDTEANLTRIHIDTDNARIDHRITKLIETVANELVEGLQEILDNPPFEPIPIEPTDPMPIDPNPFDDPIPIPTPIPVNPPVYDS